MSHARTNEAAFEAVIQSALLVNAYALGTGTAIPNEAPPRVLQPETGQKRVSPSIAGKVF